jgi:hypothetical protein
MPLCCICNRTWVNESYLYCPKCYHEWHDAIYSKAEWVVYCANSERRDRRRELADSKHLVILGDNYDISVEDGKNPKLIKLKDRYNDY